MTVAIDTLKELERAVTATSTDSEDSQNTLVAMRIVFSLIQEMMMEGLRTDSKINDSIGKGQESMTKLVEKITAQIEQIQKEYNDKAEKAGLWGKIGMALGIASTILSFVPGAQGIAVALRVASFAAGALSVGTGVAAAVQAGGVNASTGLQIGLGAATMLVAAFAPGSGYAMNGAMKVVAKAAAGLSAAAGVAAATTGIVGGAYELQAASRGKDLGENQADVILISGYQQTAQGVSHRMSEWEDEGTKTLTDIRGSVTEGILAVREGQTKAAQEIRSGFNRL